MSRLFRATALVFVLLIESLGSAWALAPAWSEPVGSSMSAPAETQDHAAMPCHDDTPAQAAMPCCGDQDDCRCSVSCFGAASPLAPAFALLSTPPLSTPPQSELPLDPLSAHGLRLLRPPAFLQS